MSAPRYAQGGYVGGDPVSIRLCRDEYLMRPTDDNSRPGYMRFEICHPGDVVLRSVWLPKKPLDDLR